MNQHTCGPSRDCVWRKAERAKSNPSRFCIALTQAGDPCAELATRQVIPWDQARDPEFVGQPLCETHFYQMRRCFDGLINGGIGYLDGEPPPVEPDPPKPKPTYFDTPGIVGFVYFARRGDVVKIGFTQNPKQRMSDLQNQGGFVFDETVMVEADRRLETHLHRQFQEHRTIGEWFTMVPEIEQAIDSLRK